MSQQEVARLAKIIQDANDRSIKIGMHIDEAVRRIGSPSETMYFSEKYVDWYQRKSSQKHSYELINADRASAQRQDRNMNKNDDEAWLIGNQWIFIDKNKIITSIGPSQYDFK